MRTHSYIRYSDHKQDDGFSVEYQMTEIEEFTKKNGLDLRKNHIDQAVSGTKTAGREAFFELMNEVKNGSVDVIIVYKLNRLFRNAYESQKYRKFLKKHGVKLMSVTQQIDEETSAGRLTTSILSDIDQYQSETISDHVKSSMREMARQGYFTGGTVPFGYKLKEIENGKKKRKKYIPHETEKDIVVKIFEMYAENYSLRQLQQYLTAAGQFTRQGKMFGLTTIARMLNNDFYIGTLRYKTEGYEDIVVENAVPAIIQPALWRKVQDRKEAAKLVEPRKRKDLYSLTGKIFCGCCNAHFFGIRSKSKQGSKCYEYQYYVCSNRKNYRSCKCGQLRKDFIENTVLQEIKTKILNKAAIDRLSVEIAALYNANPYSLSNQHKVLLKRSTELEKRLEILIEMRLSGEMSAEVIRNKSVGIEAELAEVKNDIITIEERQKNAITTETVKAYLNKMLKSSENIDDEVLKTLFDHFVEKIVITDETADIHLIVRPLGQFVYKRSYGQPNVTLSTKINRL